MSVIDSLKNNLFMIQHKLKFLSSEWEDEVPLLSPKSELKDTSFGVPT